jgi:hypothetical protein
MLTLALYLSPDDPKLHLQALKYFKEAYQMQNFQAIYHLGEMYYYGLGVQKKCEEASRVRILRLDLTILTNQTINMSNLLHISPSTSISNMSRSVEVGTMISSQMHTPRTKLAIWSMLLLNTYRPQREDTRLDNPTLLGFLIEVQRWTWSFPNASNVCGGERTCH